MSPAWPSLALIAIIGGAVFFVFSRYNGLIRSLTRVHEAWSGIDVQLRRRAASCRISSRPSGTTRGTSVRSSNRCGAMQQAGGAGQTAAASNMLTQALGHLFAVVENYAQLRASENFLTLKEDVRDTEEKIAFARQFYNRNVLDYNTRIATYPDAALANQFGFTLAEFFETDGDGRAEVHVSFDRASAAPQQPAAPPAA